MKKTIRNIIAVMVLAILFVSCNADLDQKGIFESMMSSAPNTDYTIQKFSGVLDGKFIIETNNGIELLTKEGSKSTLVNGLKARLMFTQGNNIFYAIDKEGDIHMPNLMVADKSTPDQGKIVTLKDGSGVTFVIENSFYEVNEKYVLKMKGSDGNYYFTADAADGTLAGTDYTFNTVKKANGNTPVYIGANLYYIDQDKGKSYKVYSIGAANSIKISESDFTSKPVAAIDNKIFLSDSTIYTVSGNTATQLMSGDKAVKHSYAYVSPNHDAALAMRDSVIYGCFGSKPFTLNGTEYADPEQIGSGVSIIDVYFDGSDFYAFSAENGLYRSAYGVSYTRMNN